MSEITLRYGLNPHQTPAKVRVVDGNPLRVVNGAPGYINLMDALNGWQLVRELRDAIGLPAAASFKHVSPAGVGAATPLSDALRKAYHLDDTPLSGIATAYARARGADRMSSYGDFISLSDECDAATAGLIAREVSDGIIAPSYSADALAILKRKKKGRYLVLQMDGAYRPAGPETRDIFGITFEQARNDLRITDDLLRNIPTAGKVLTEEAKRDLLIALITLKYTQSNSVCYALDGQTIGVGAGQQSRIHCVRLAGNKADLWYLRQHPDILALPFRPDARLVDRDNAVDVLLGDNPEEIADGDRWNAVFTRRPVALDSAEKKRWLAGLDGVSLGSDAFFPFGDNIERAARSGVRYIAQAGGSVRDDHVIAACDRHGITMAFTGVRLFHH